VPKGVFAAFYKTALVFVHRWTLLLLASVLVAAFLLTAITLPPAASLVCNLTFWPAAFFWPATFLFGLQPFCLAYNLSFWPATIFFGLRPFFLACNLFAWPATRDNLADSLKLLLDVTQGIPTDSPYFNDACAGVATMACLHDPSRLEIVRAVRQMLLNSKGEGVGADGGGGGGGSVGVQMGVCLWVWVAG
jgi:hypothetical protein